MVYMYMQLLCSDFCWHGVEVIQLQMVTLQREGVCPFFSIFYQVFLSRYGPTLRASMGKYAIHHGVAAAARHFSHKLGVDFSTSSIHSIKSTYKFSLIFRLSFTS